MLHNEDSDSSASSDVKADWVTLSLYNDGKRLGTVHVFSDLDDEVSTARDTKILLNPVCLWQGNFDEIEYASLWTPGFTNFLLI